MSVKEEFLRNFGKSAIMVAMLIDELNPFQLARLMLTQAALETGWGRHVPSNNLFGIKDLSWLPGAEEYFTKEHRNGKTQKMIDAFQTFDDPTQSFLAYAILLTQSQRYHYAWVHRFNPQRFFEELQKAGYATDPQYAKKCIAVYQSFPDDWLAIALRK